jgi:hypothetical protein
MKPSMWWIASFVVLAMVAVAGAVVSTASSSGGQDVAVGGAQFVYPCAAGQETDSLSAHVPTGTAVTPGTAQPTAGGTFNATIPQSSAAACGSVATQLVAKVDCVRVSAGSPPGTADITAQVIKATGAYATQGPEISISVTDSGTNSGDSEVFAHSPAPCVFTSHVFGQFPVHHGNFNIHSHA